jgi:hypothetical protein
VLQCAGQKDGQGDLREQAVARRFGSLDARSVQLRRAASSWRCIVQRPMSNEHDQAGIAVPFRPLFVELPQARIDKLRRVTRFYLDYISPELLAPLRRAELAAVMMEYERDPEGWLEELKRITRKREASAARLRALLDSLAEGSSEGASTAV